MTYWLIILGIIIVILIYILFTFFYATPPLISKADMNNQIPMITHNSLENAASQSYTYNLWISLNALPASQNSCNYIFNMGPMTTGAPSFILYFDTNNKPRLSIALGEGNITNNVFSLGSNPPKNNQLITDNFPLQTWVFLSISVESGNIVDCYINGKLVKSFYTSSVVTPKGDINFGILNANISQFSRLPNASDPQTVWNEYLKGNGIANSKSYGMNMALTQNNIAKNTWVIF
jgi:hypothetical protein